MTMRASVRDAMLAAVPSLRAFAISLCGNVDRADDLVQETLLRAMANINSFQPGTNMSAWLFTILRNLFRSEYRKRRREVEDTDGGYAENSQVASRAAQPGGIPGVSRGLGQAAPRSTRGVNPGGCIRVLLRGGGGDLRLCGRHNQKQSESRPHAAFGSAVDRGCGRFWPGPYHPGDLVGRRTQLIPIPFLLSADAAPDHAGEH